MILPKTGTSTGPVHPICLQLNISLFMWETLLLYVWILERQGASSR